MPRLKNKNFMAISILLQKSENLENSKLSDFIKENIAKFLRRPSKINENAWRPNFFLMTVIDN